MNLMSGYIVPKVLSIILPFDFMVDVYLYLTILFLIESSQVFISLHDFPLSSLYLLYILDDSFQTTHNRLSFLIIVGFD